MSNKSSYVTEIDGVYRIRIEIPFDVKDVSVYIFDIDDKKVLVDAGLNVLNWKKKFLAALSGLNIRLQDIDYCIVSHEHLDHCGLIKLFKRKNPDMKIVMHGITNDSLRMPSNPENSATIEKNANEFGKVMASYGMPKSCIRRTIKQLLIWSKIARYQEPDILVEDDDELSFKTSKLRFIWTPGHSLGHICTFETKNNHLFSGDHILSRITPHIGQYHMISLIDNKYIYPNILDNYLQSLDKIYDLNPKIIFPGHQEIIHNPLERISEIKAHHQTRFEEIHNTIKDKPLTPFEISEIHFGMELDDLNKYLAINEVLSHLIYLEKQEKVDRIERDGKVFFTINS